MINMVKPKSLSDETKVRFCGELRMSGVFKVEWKLFQRNGEMTVTRNKPGDVDG